MTSASIISLNIPDHGRLKPIHEPASLQTASQSVRADGCSKQNPTYIAPVNAALAVLAS